MFRKRELAIQLRKAERSKDTNEKRDETMSFEEKVAAAAPLFKTVVRHIAVGVVAYVLLDTYRQVQVAKNTNPQPE